MNSTYERIMNMSTPELDAFAKLHHVDVDSITFDDEDHARRHVCEQLNIERPVGEDDHVGAELDKLVREWMQKHNCTYEHALGAVRNAAPVLAKDYAESFGGTVRTRSKAA